MKVTKDATSRNFRKKLRFVREYAAAARAAAGITKLCHDRQFEISCLGYEKGGEFGNLLDCQIVRCHEFVWRGELEFPEVLDGVCKEIRRRRRSSAPMSV